MRAVHAALKACAKSGTRAAAVLMSKKTQLCVAGGKWALQSKEPVPDVLDVSDECDVGKDEHEVDKRLERFHWLADKYSGEIRSSKRCASYSEQDQRVVVSMLKDAGGNCHLVAEVCR